MDKNSIKVKEQIDLAAEPFYVYLEEILGNSIFSKIKDIANDSGNIYIFSGVIRDFFLKRKGIRDLDIIIDQQINIEKYFPKDTFRMNSFGGYKILFNNLEIDLWALTNTWTLKNVPVLFDLDIQVPHTAFFNFSSISYDFKNKKFNYSESFINFLKNKKIDVVNPINPNRPLCIVNTFYYRDKLELKVSNSLKRLILDWCESENLNLNIVQLKHFGKVLYDEKKIESNIKLFKRDLARASKK